MKFGLYNAMKVGKKTYPSQFNLFLKGYLNKMKCTRTCRLDLIMKRSIRCRLMMRLCLILSITKSFDKDDATATATRPELGFNAAKGRAAVAASIPLFSVLWKTRK